MYYVKTTLKTDDFLETTLTQEICDGDDGNVFTLCPGCGEEIHADLAEVFAHGGDLFSTETFCEKCSKNGKSEEWVDFMNGKRDTFNGKTRADMEAEIDTAIKKADEIIGETKNEEGNA